MEPRGPVRKNSHPLLIARSTECTPGTGTFQTFKEKKSVIVYIKVISHSFIFTRSICVDNMVEFYVFI